MKTLSKYAVAAVLTGAFALAAATPSQARWHGHGGWHNGGAGAAIGFGAGALLGATVAGAAYQGYYGYGYDDGAGYAYAPGPYESYGDDFMPMRPGPTPTAMRRAATAGIARTRVAAVPSRRHP